MDQSCPSTYDLHKGLSTKHLYDVACDGFVGDDFCPLSHKCPDLCPRQETAPLSGSPVLPGTVEPLALVQLEGAKAPNLSTGLDLQNLDTLRCSDVPLTYRRVASNNLKEISMAPSNDTSSDYSKEAAINWWSDSANILESSASPVDPVVEMAQPACTSQYATDSWARRIEATADKYKASTNSPRLIPPTPPSSTIPPSNWEHHTTMLEGVWGDHQHLIPTSSKMHTEALTLQMDYDHSFVNHNNQQAVLQTMSFQQSPTPPDSRTPSFQDIVFSPNAPSASTFTSPDVESQVSWEHQRPEQFAYKYETSPNFDYSTVQSWWPPSQHNDRQSLSSTCIRPPQQNGGMYSGSGLGFDDQAANFISDCTTLPSNDRVFSFNRASSSSNQSVEASRGPLSPTSVQETSQGSRTPSPPLARRPKAKKSSSSIGPRKGKGTTGGRTGSNKNSNKAASVGFVNFTPDDSQRILTGVAPSGSSKTKARREREAQEKRRRMSMAAAKAVLDAGGNLENLEKEGLFIWDFPSASSSPPPTSA